MGEPDDDKNGVIAASPLNTFHRLGNELARSFRSPQSSRSSTGSTTTLAPCSTAAPRPRIGGPDVVDTFTGAAAEFGLPASALTDNGAVFAGRYRGTGRVAPESHPACARHQLPSF